MGSDEFDFDDDDGEGDDAIRSKKGAQGDAGLSGSVPGLSTADQEAFLDNDYEGEDDDGSEEFQPNPKWLLPEYRPAGWVESDANNAKRSSTDADVAEVSPVPSTSNKQNPSSIKYWLASSPFVAQSSSRCSLADFHQHTLRAGSINNLPILRSFYPSVLNLSMTCSPSKPIIPCCEP